MLRRSLIGALLLLAAVAPVASAAEPLPKGAEGTFELNGTHGYQLLGLIASTGKTGVLSLFVDKRGSAATYLVHGEVTREHVHFDLGQLGEIDVAVEPTGRMETVGSECGKSTKLEAEEYVGTIAFHGEEGFTEAEASRAPLRLEPLFDLLCGRPTVQGMTTSGGRIRGAELRIEQSGGPRLRLDQNHRGARVFYEAHMTEKEGAVRVNRAVAGHLGGGSLSFKPSLAAAAFSAGYPFSGRATYVGRRPPGESRPGEGTWRGELEVDFPGHAGVRLADPGFSASIAHAKRTESRG